MIENVTMVIVMMMRRRRTRRRRKRKTRRRMRRRNPHVSSKMQFRTTWAQIFGANCMI